MVVRHFKFIKSKKTIFTCFRWYIAFWVFREFQCLDKKGKNYFREFYRVSQDFHEMWNRIQRSLRLTCSWYGHELLYLLLTKWKEPNVWPKNIIENKDGSKLNGTFPFLDLEQFSNLDFGFRLVNLRSYRFLLTLFVPKHSSLFRSRKFTTSICVGELPQIPITVSALGIYWVFTTTNIQILLLK